MEGCTPEVVCTLVPWGCWCVERVHCWSQVQQRASEAQHSDAAFARTCCAGPLPSECPSPESHCCHQQRPRPIWVALGLPNALMATLAY